MATAKRVGEVIQELSIASAGLVPKESATAIRETMNLRIFFLSVE
jgi:hypothetical protein